MFNNLRLKIVPNKYFIWCNVCLKFQGHPKLIITNYWPRGWMWWPWVTDQIFWSFHGDLLEIRIIQPISSLHFHSPQLYSCGGRNLRDRYLKTWTNQTKTICIEMMWRLYVNWPFMLLSNYLSNMSSYNGSLDMIRKMTILCIFLHFQLVN